jgi:seipin
MLGILSESETLSIPMVESASFPKGWKNAPAYIMLELQPKQGQEVQVYDARVRFTARFGGLRWLMYNHRFISFVAFTGAFWVSEVFFAGLSWVVVRHLFTPKKGTGKVKGKIKEDADADADASEKIKMEETDEEPDLSDTPRTFPTYGRQAPLRYTPRVKDEDSEEFVLDERAVQPSVAEADDEEEDHDGVDFALGRGGRTDSGLGTSFSDRGERSGLARRRTGAGRGTE